MNLTSLEISGHPIIYFTKRQKDDERFTIYNLLRQKNRIRNFSQLRKKLREKMKFSSAEEINFDVCVNIRG